MTQRKLSEVCEEVAVRVDQSILDGKTITSLQNTKYIWTVLKKLAKRVEELENNRE